MAYFREKAKILHTSQHGGLAHRTPDHMYHMKPLQTKQNKTYHFYIAFNKAFGSVPQQALFQMLNHYNIPTHLIDTLKN